MKLQSPQSALPQARSGRVEDPPVPSPETPTTTTIPEISREFPIPDEILSQLNPKQLAAIELLAQGASFQLTAAQLNIDPKTLYNWRKNPHFQSHLELRREETLGQATDHYRSMLVDTLDILFKQANHPYAPTSHRAARSLLALSRLGFALVPQQPKAPPANAPRYTTLQDTHAYTQQTDSPRPQHSEAPPNGKMPQLQPPGSGSDPEV
jgi:hypothetical protein